MRLWLKESVILFGTGMLNTSAKSIYVHIPFCVRKCLYCDFVSYTGKEDVFQSYCDALKREIERSAAKGQNAHISTVYFGGGTPTIMHPGMLSNILDAIKSNFVLAADAEITIEANPGIKGLYGPLRDAGFNRLSLGVQSFQDEELQCLGRIHSADDASDAIQEAIYAGFDNISIDLMYGIPSQTRESWRDTLNRAIDTGCQHISLYSLTVEPGTHFYWMMEHEDLELPGDYIETDMYEDTIRILTNCGFEHYEISSFAKSGFRCRHNITYWKNEPYFGFGAAACSYIDGVRSTNTPSLDEYLYAIGNAQSPVTSEECLRDRESMGETVFLALRMTDGLSLRSFQKRYGVSVYDVYHSEIDGLVSKGMLVCDDESIRLTHKGLLFSNDVFAEFV